LQTEPPRISHDVASLIAKGATVYALAEDLTERGLDCESLIDGIEPIGMAALAPMLARYERVWHW
jgi:sulfur relay (sulfurtransferase) DsrF/TusC family protein